MNNKINTSVHVLAIDDIRSDVLIHLRLFDHSKEQMRRTNTHACVVLLIFSLVIGEIVYDTEDDNAHGLRISGNDQFAVYAMNRDGGFVFTPAPFEPMQRCGYWNGSRDFYVYSLAALTTTENGTSNPLLTFVQIAEQTATQNVYFSVITMNKSSCVNQTVRNVIIRDTLIWNGTHQEYMSLKVVPSQRYAYVFADSFVLMFDIVNNRIAELKSTNRFYSLPMSIVPHAVDLTEQWGLVVAYVVSPTNVKVAVPVIILCSLQPLTFLTYMFIMEGFTQSIASATTYNLANHMSISVHAQRQMAIVGFPLVGIVMLVGVNATSNNASQWTIRNVRMDMGPRLTQFGQSVAWVDNQTVAVVLLSINSRPWSTSEVWTFAVDAPFRIPRYVFPNSQQTLLVYTPPRFYQILSWSNHLFILTDLYRTILVPSRLAGYQSALIDSREPYIMVYNSSICIPGTYKSDVGFGLCTLCPPQTKNPALQACVQCLPCSSDAFCPLGSIDTVSFANYSSHIQTYAYPDSPDMNNYDDILVQNIFSIGQSTRCLLISPLFWTVIATSLCFIVWLLMAMGKIFECRFITRHRAHAKKFLKNTDIVGEGERWIGGLFSFAIVVLFGFTFWFANDYLPLYPIETSSSPHASCDDTMRNSIFDNALQLPLSNLDGTRWPIFDMLDAQPFTATFDLINTAAPCQSITVQQNRVGVNALRLSNVSCLTQPDNVSLSITFPLPSHQLTVQMNITGSYSIGGFRFCLRGPARANGVHTLQTLDMCRLFYTENETLSRTSTLSVVLVRVVNQTKPLQVGDDTYYSGRWTPTFGDYAISDKLVYEQDGEYLRYVTQRTTLTMFLTEQSFFLQNNQKPIVRIAELSFHTLLFCTLIIELFAMAFLLFKLIGMPLIRLFLRCRRGKQQLTNNSDEQRKPQPSLTLSNAEFRRFYRQYERRKHRHQQKRNKDLHTSSNIPSINIDMQDHRTKF